MHRKGSRPDGSAAPHARHLSVEDRRHPRPLTDEDRRRRATEIRETMHDERAITIAKARLKESKRKHG
jgi:hypothetical protein